MPCVVRAQGAAAGSLRGPSAWCGGAFLFAHGALGGSTLPQVHNGPDVKAACESVSAGTSAGVSQVPLTPCERFMFWHFGILNTFFALLNCLFFPNTVRSC